jgi:hypothetical protein
LNIEIKSMFEEVPFRGFRGSNAIANQCPAAGGQSVYRARAMLALINDSLAYDDALTCLQAGIYRELNTEIITPVITIIPNPADNWIFRP